MSCWITNARYWVQLASVAGVLECWFWGVLVLLLWGCGGVADEMVWLDCWRDNARVVGADAALPEFCNFNIGDIKKYNSQWRRKDPIFKKTVSPHVNCVCKYINLVWKNFEISFRYFCFVLASYLDGRNLKIHFVDFRHIVSLHFVWSLELKITQTETCILWQ